MPNMPGGVQRPPLAALSPLVLPRVPVADGAGLWQDPEMPELQCSRPASAKCPRASGGFPS